MEDSKIMKITAERPTYDDNQSKLGHNGQPMLACTIDRIGS